MILIDRLPSTPPPPGSVADSLVLTWEQRSKTRQQLSTAGGRLLGIKLPTGTRMPPACIVYIGDGFHVQVEAADEDLWLIRAADAPTLARVAYEIGNRHFPIAICGDGVTVLYDHTLSELWERLGVHAERSLRPFLSDQPPSVHQH